MAGGYVARRHHYNDPAPSRAYRGSHRLLGALKHPSRAPTPPARAVGDHTSPHGQMRPDGGAGSAGRISEARCPRDRALLSDRAGRDRGRQPRSTSRRPRALPNLDGSAIWLAATPTQQLLDRPQLLRDRSDPTVEERGQGWIRPRRASVFHHKPAIRLVLRDLPYRPHTRSTTAPQHFNRPPHMHPHNA